MSERIEAQTTDYRWAVVVALTVSILALLALVFTGAHIWLVIPALIALGFALLAAIRNSQLRVSASVACVLAAIVGGAGILFG